MADLKGCKTGNSTRNGLPFRDVCSLSANNCGLRRSSRSVVLFRRDLFMGSAVRCASSEIRIMRQHSGRAPAEPHRVEVPHWIVKLAWKTLTRSEPELPSQ